MTREIFRKQLKHYKGRVLDNKTIKSIAEDMEKEVFDYMYNTGFEIWNSGCTYRLIAGRGDKDWAVCEYNDPLHPEKEYMKLSSALQYMEE